MELRINSTFGRDEGAQIKIDRETWKQKDGEMKRHYERDRKLQKDEQIDEVRETVTLTKGKDNECTKSCLI